MQNLIDTRVLKKTIKYLVIWNATFFGALGILFGFMWLSFYLFDSLYPLTAFLLCFGLIILTYLMASEKVEAERREEQRLVDKLIRDAEHAEKISGIEQKYGIKVTP